MGAWQNNPKLCPPSWAKCFMALCNFVPCTPDALWTIPTLRCTRLHAPTVINASQLMGQGASELTRLLQALTVLHCDHGFAIACFSVSLANMPLSKHGTVVVLFS